MVRRLLFALLLAGIAGLLLELYFLEHTESQTQIVPLIVLALGIPTALGAATRPSRTILHLFRWTMVLFVLTGIAGLYLHFRGNLEFEREMDDGAAGLALAWEALRGATPTLAPGAMIQLGLLGLVAAYGSPRHQETP